MRRVRRNVDVGLRRLERAVAGGDYDATVGLVQARMRLGMIRERAVRDALCFSYKLSPPGVASTSYTWFPFGWGHNELVTPLSEFEQDSRTIFLNEICSVALGRAYCRKPRLKIPDRTRAWMARRGFGIYETGGVGNHPPMEIQSDDDPERDTWEFQRQLVRAYNAAERDIIPPPGGGSSVDIAYQWLVRQGAFANALQPTRILLWLRRHSTVEYCAVLGASVYGPWPPPEERPRLGGLPFGQTELLLVSTLLGGAPL